MIARIRPGWAPPDTADNYQRHDETEVAAHLSRPAEFTVPRAELVAELE
jgi:hypothetical protein